MIPRGLLRLALGQKSGIAEFGNTLDSLTASLAPLIAFPLVGAAVAILAGEWELAIIGFLARLCAVLAVQLLIHQFARLWDREALWLRAATALNWSFWLVIPAVIFAAIIAAIAAAAGLDLIHAKAVGLGLILGYMLWLLWFVPRAGLDLSIPRATMLVVVLTLVIFILTASPRLLDVAFYGKAAFQ